MGAAPSTTQIRTRRIVVVVTQYTLRCVLTFAFSCLRFCGAAQAGQARRPPCALSAPRAAAETYEIISAVVPLV